MLTALAAVIVLAGPQSVFGQFLQNPPASGVGNPANQVVYSGFSDWGGVVFRVHHHTENYGEEAGKTAFGLNKTFIFDRFALFGDGSYRIDDEGSSSASAGGGVRFLYQDWFSGTDRIAGASFWYDGDDLGHVYEQFGVSLESLGDRWDFRLGVNIPVGEKEIPGAKAFVPNTFRFHGNNLVMDTAQYRESAMTVVDAEAALRLGQYNIWAFVGGYYLDGGGKQAAGGKGGFRGYVARDLSLSLTVSNDPVFDTAVVFGLTWFFDLTNRGRAQMSPTSIVDRLREPVHRNDYVAVWKRTEQIAEPLTAPDGSALFFVHVDSAAPAGGNGTFESPYATLAAAQAGSNAGNYIFLHSGSVFSGQSITLKETQRLLGDGIAGGHQVQTAQLGTVTLPSTAGAIPVIQNAPGAAVTLASNNLVSGLIIDGGAQGIVAPAGTSNNTVDRVGVQNTTGVALDFQGAGGTTTVDEFFYNGGAVGAGGIRFAGLTGTAAVSNSALSGGAGPGLSVENSSGSVTVTNTTIDDTGGAGVSINGGSANVAFTGKITQANNAAAVSVAGGHTGTVTFTPATAGDNVIEATNGTGIQLNNANGAYTFGKIALNGGDAGIDIVNSSGDITFQSGTITNPAGTAVTVNGGAANVAIGATIANNADHSVVVTGITGGEIDFNGAITDTGQGVLVNNNTGGVVYFAGDLTLNTGANDAVTLTNNTGAIVALSDLDINTTSGRGFVATGGGTIAVVGPNATITTTTGSGLNLNGVVVHAAGMAFDSISVNGAANGILLADVTGGTISVGAGGAAAGDGGTLANTTGDAVSAANVAGLSLKYMNITNAGGDGVDATNVASLTLNNMSITGATGDGVHLAHNGAAASTVNVTANTISGFGGQGIELAATGAGTMTLNLTNNTLSGATGADSILLNVNDAATQVNLTIADNNVNNGAGFSALALNATGAGAKTVTMLMDGNNFVNDSAAATVAINDTGAVTLNSTVTDNTFTNNGAGLQFTMETNDAAAVIALNLNGNNANAGAGSFDLTNTNGTFGVYDEATVSARNNNCTVNETGTIDDLGPAP